MEWMIYDFFEISILTLFSPKYKAFCGFHDGKNHYGATCEECSQGNASWCKVNCQWTDQKCIFDESESFIFDYLG